MAPYAEQYGGAGNGAPKPEGDYQRDMTGGTAQAGERHILPVGAHVVRVVEFKHPRGVTSEYAAGRTTSDTYQFVLEPVGVPVAGEFYDARLFFRDADFNTNPAGRLNQFRACCFGRDLTPPELARFKRDELMGRVLVIQIEHGKPTADGRVFANVVGFDAVTDAVRAEYDKALGSDDPGDGERQDEAGADTADTADADTADADTADADTADADTADADTADADTAAAGEANDDLPF